MILITCCDVCYTPKIWTEDKERWLLITLAVQCEYCKQYSMVPWELKKEIRERW